ncbi:TRAP transporter small permease subunit [Alkalihalophilus marmarensis]|jgi:TRAP-type mannitol/chloroaromatic compound transport system permease small subunit|uniref:TRAP transporter small permease n=1 Tax=Alkalihalophilus marmarensis TaxID=521377 RepID=UPI00203F0728|nr:TRAP transporter small permease subunit [Alkalihalophilus marmarensis]MCM3491614.1 TRAP transporter small permease subunit [Alkalihalophilus marmarensis]
MMDMNGLKKAYKWFDYMKIAGVWISGISLLGMMFFIVVDVLLRNVYSNSINGGFEIVQNYFMPLVVFPALAYIYASGVLPRMDLLIEKFKRSIRKCLIIGMLVIEIFILVIMAKYTLDYAMNGLARQMSFPAAGTLYPLYPLFFLIPISFLLIIIENMFLLIKNALVKEPTLLFKYDKNADHQKG